jgi:hypothetical protein
MPFKTYAPVTGTDPINTVTGGFLRFQGGGPVVARADEFGSATVSTAGTYVVEYAFDNQTFGQLSFNGTSATLGKSGNANAAAINRFPVVIGPSESFTVSVNNDARKGYFRFIDISERLDLSDVASTHSISSGGSLPVSELSYVVGGTNEDAEVRGPDDGLLSRAESCHFLTDVNATFKQTPGVVTKIRLNSLISTNFTLISKLLGDGQTHSVSGDRLITSAFAPGSVVVNGARGPEYFTEGALGRLTLVKDDITSNRFNGIRLVGMEF